MESDVVEDVDEVDVQLSSGIACSVSLSDAGCAELPLKSDVVEVVAVVDVMVSSGIARSAVPSGANDEHGLCRRTLWQIGRSLVDYGFRAGAMDESDDELVDATERQQLGDPLVGRPVLLRSRGIRMTARIEGVELGARSGRRWYCLRFPDGDVQHCSESEAAWLTL